MKKIILLSMVLLLTGATIAKGKSNSYALTVVIKNFKNTDGKARVTYFDSQEKFLKEGEVVIIDITDKNEITVVFENMKTGIVAISVIHDENENGDLDTGLFGIPTEDYGFSNDAKGNFGPPSFKDCQLEFSTNKTIEINLN